MIGNLPSETDKEQESHVVNIVLGEGLIALLQAHTFDSSKPDLGDITKDLLAFDSDAPRQDFSEGGLAGLEAVASLGFSAVTNASPASIAFGLANVVSVAATGKSIADQFGLNLSAFSSPNGFFSGKFFDIEIENPATGQITTRSGRQAIEDSQRGTPDLTFSPAPPIGFLGTGNKSNVTTPISVQQAPAVALSSDPAGSAESSVGNVTGETTADANVAAESLGLGDTGDTDDTSDTGNTADDDGVAGGTSDGPGDAGDDGGPGLTHGGVIKGYQEGDLVEDQQADTQLDALGLGPVGLVDDPDGTTGVADDLAMDLPVNSYVVNKDAATLAGLGSINKLIKDAIDLALEDEVDLPAEIKTAEKIPIRISRGEIVIPAPLVDYIGLKKLENMNNRGLKVRKQREAEEAPVEMAAAPSPQQDLLAQIQPVA